MLLGEVSPGGVGVGLNGLLILALLAVFIAGLMVGRTPEYLGKKIQAQEIKLVVLYILVMPVVVLAFTGMSVVLDTALASRLNPGPHGLSEILYGFASTANNNGSAFGGLTGNTQWYNTMLGIATLFGRFFLIIPTLALAGLARPQAPGARDGRHLPHAHAAVRRPGRGRRRSSWPGSRSSRRWRSAPSSSSSVSRSGP